MPILTLTTDFGLHDGFAGVLKGVIWGICPMAQIADISNSISPQNVLEGALVLSRAVPYFPDGTIHVAVVDPGVGTRRRALAARFEKFDFVGPDNGLVTPLLEAAEAGGEKVDFVEIVNPKFLLPQVSHTFHGRDIFAPAAAHLANGVPLADLGPAIKDLVRLSLPKPEKTVSGWLAQVTGVDGFGNLATDLPGEEILGKGYVVIRVGDHAIRGLVLSYGQRPAGELVALIDSAGYLEIAVVDGSAAQLLNLGTGSPVEVILS